VKHEFLEHAQEEQAHAEDLSSLLHGVGPARQAGTAAAR